MFGVLVLGGCGDVGFHPGEVGRLIDQRPAPVTLVPGGPSGVLVSGPYVPDVPDSVVDRAVGEGLRSWLTFEERQALAMASQRAAIAPTTTAIDWDARDGKNDVTAAGTAVPVGGIFRSSDGHICRDVRQSFAKNAVPHAETVTLCREDVAVGVAVWLGRAG